MTRPGAAPDPPHTADRPRPVFSRFYAAISERNDGEGLAALLAELLAPPSGAVVEIGAGDGRNFARYRPAVTRVTAVEPEPRLRARELRRRGACAWCCAPCPTARPRWPRSRGSRTANPTLRPADAARPT
jgi:hypothetical protein